MERDAMAKKVDIKRYPLNMRTTKSLRQRLERAAKKSGRSLAQEVERRLERSLDIEQHLVVTRGGHWSPLLVHKDELWLILGDDPRDFLDEERPVVLKIDSEDLKRFRNYFGGAPYPYDYSNEEIEAAGDSWVQMQSDIKRGK
jgi:hypothetical protein